MIWYLLLGLGALIVLIFSIALLSPASLHFTAKVNNDVTSYSMTAFWIHPFIIRLRYSQDENVLITELLGKRLGNKKVDSIAECSNDKMEDGSSRPDTDTGQIEKVILEQTNDEIKSNHSEQTHMNDNSSIADTREKSVKKNDTQKKSDRKNPKKDFHDKSEEKKRSNIFSPVVFFKELKTNPFIFFLLKNKLRKKISAWLANVVRSFFKIIRINRFSIFVRKGFDDPSVSGKVFGCIEALKHALIDNEKKIQLQYQPDFTNQPTLINCELKVKSSLAMILMPLVIIIFTFPYLTFLTTWLDYRSFSKRQRLCET